MCNHYTQSDAAAAMAAQEIADLEIEERAEKYAEHIYPKYAAPIVMQAGQRRIMRAMKWGIMVPIQGKPKPVTNSRHDKLTSFTWRFAVAERRCLIPAAGYFEPGLGPVGAKGEILFTVKDRPTFFFAGLWEGKVEEPEGLTFSMVTTTPNEFVAKFHDRMPVVLAREDALTWLGETPLEKEEIARLCRGLPSEALLHHELPPKLKVTRPAKVDAPPAAGEQGTLL